jgi:predicted transglutaminase-like cysteine proteinase
MCGRASVCWAIALLALFSVGARAAEPAAVQTALAAVFQFAQVDPARMPDMLWTGVLARVGAEYCPEQSAACQRWRDTKSSLTQPFDPARAIARVNSVMNALPYRSDEQNWHALDHWATPAQFLRAGGDCEDFAIAKYFMLRELGFAAADMRIAVVDDLGRGIIHAVLVVQTGSGPMVLDNRAQDIRAAARLAHYRPLFAVNEDGLFIFTRPAALALAVGQ